MSGKFRESRSKTEVAVVHVARSKCEFWGTSKDTDAQGLHSLKRTSTPLTSQKASKENLIHGEAPSPEVSRIIQFVDDAVTTEESSGKSGVPVKARISDSSDDGKEAVEEEVKASAEDSSEQSSPGEPTSSPAPARSTRIGAKATKVRPPLRARPSPRFEHPTWRRTHFQELRSPETLFPRS
eukprot:1192120-Prorocentrum_minimum.AAC.1